MKKYRLSFAYINIIDNKIAEVIVNEGINVSLEMIEEHDDLLMKIFDGKFGILVNKINNYSYSIEAQLIMGSLENIAAIAAITYSVQGGASSKLIADIRIIDQLNVKTFSGLELGWQQAVSWLQNEIAMTSVTSI